MTEIYPTQSVNLKKNLLRLLNEKKVAVKILRPNIQKKVDKDIQLLRIFSWLLEYIWSDGKRLKPQEVVEEFSKHTRSELNLLLEAAHCSHLGENFKDKKLLFLPLGGTEEIGMNFNLYRYEWVYWRIFSFGRCI